ncbi:hypothetical protein BRADI_4g29041v3, partial [Brachypodium distachyon]
QFKYKDYNLGDYKYTTQLGCILKRQYLGVLKDEDGESYPAATWADYYDKINDQGESCADKVKKEFWRLFTVANEHKREAARVLENYCKKRVRNIMYQVHVDVVKLHYENQGEILDDTLACRRELSENEYLNARIECDEFKEKRSKAQDSRLSNVDVAQNRGGSRSFAETQQFIEAVHGPEKATILNTYDVMKSGAKNINNNGSSGVIPSQKAQKRMPEVDGHVLYTKGGGLPHGRLIIGDGAVRKEDVIAAAKGRKSRPSSSNSYRHLSEENHVLRRANEGLTQHNGAPGSSHAGSQSIHNDGMDGAETSANGNNNAIIVEINDTAIGLNNNRGDNVAGENGSDDDSEALYANGDIHASHEAHDDACFGREADLDAT